MQWPPFSGLAAGYCCAADLALLLRRLNCMSFGPKSKSVRVQTRPPCSSQHASADIEAEWKLLTSRTKVCGHCKADLRRRGAIPLAKRTLVHCNLGHNFKWFTMSKIHAMSKCRSQTSTHRTCGPSARACRARRPPTLFCEVAEELPIALPFRSLTSRRRTCWPSAHVSRAWRTRTLRWTRRRCRRCRRGRTRRPPPPHRCRGRHRQRASGRGRRPSRRSLCRCQVRFPLQRQRKVEDVLGR